MSQRVAGLLLAVEGPWRVLLRSKPRIAMDVTGLTLGALVLAVLPAISGPEDTTFEGTLLWASGTTDDHRVRCDVPRREVAIRPGDCPASASSRPCASPAGITRRPYGPPATTRSSFRSAVRKKRRRVKRMEDRASSSSSRHVTGRSR
jgi:hypothetical protein